MTNTLFKLSLTLFIALGFALTATPALACKCSRVTPFMASAEKAPVVLHLKAGEMKVIDGGRYREFKVVGVLKGSFKGKTVVLPAVRTSCDIGADSFTEGTEYVFSANPKGAHHTITSFSCSPGYTMVQAGKVKVSQGEMTVAQLKARLKK